MGSDNPNRDNRGSALALPQSLILSYPHPEKDIILKSSYFLGKPRQGRLKMKVKHIALALIVLTIIFEVEPNSFGASPPPVWASTANVSRVLGMRIAFGRGCDGQTDQAHISKHVPGTVNVEALTECPGEQVFIQTTISRHRWWFLNDSKTVNGKGFARVKVNVALACKWKLGDSPITYVVTSRHSNSKGERQITRTTSILKC